MADLAGRRKALQTALEQTQGETPEAQAQAVAAALSFEPGTAAGKDVVWIILVGGLMLALLGSLAGIIFDNPTDTVEKAFFALLAGVVGLIAPSPVGGGARGGGA